MEKERGRGEVKRAKEGQEGLLSDLTFSSKSLGLSGGCRHCALSKQSAWQCECMLLGELSAPCEAKPCCNSGFRDLTSESSPPGELLATSRVSNPLGEMFLPRRETEPTA